MASGKLTAFEVVVPNVSVDNLEFKIDVSKIGSAVVASVASPSSVNNLTIKNNEINPYRSSMTTVAFGSRNAVNINYGAFRIDLSNPTGILAQNNTISYSLGIDNTVGTADDAGFRAGFAMDEGTGDFTGNTIQTISQDIEIRFTNTANNINITNNNINGGGVNYAAPNISGGTLTISGNAFNGAAASLVPNSNLLRIKDNIGANTITTVVDNNTFVNHTWALSLENYKNVTVNNNTFTPLANSTNYHHITINTKEIASSSNTVTQTAIDGTLTNNTFNGSGTLGGTALKFLNHDNDAATYGTFTVGTAGNENKFNTGIQNFIAFDSQTGSTNGATFPTYPSTTGWPTTMAPWAQNLDATFNKFDVSGSLKLPSAMTFAERTSLENALTHKPDNVALGIISYFKPVHNLTQNTYFSTIQPAIAGAVTNDIIELSEWTFPEGITIDKPLTVQGVDSASVILDGATIADANGITLANGIQNIIIKNLKIKNFKGSNPLGSGIFGSENSNLMIDAVVADNNQGRGGIFIGGGSNIQNVTIKNSISKNNIVAGSRGIVIWDGFKQNITITGNKVYGNNCCGIELQDGSATGVTVTGNTVFSNFDNGIGLIGLTGPGANIVSGNIVTNNGRFGMEIKNPNGNGLSSGAGSVVIDGNTVSRTIPIVDARDIAGIAVFRRGVTALNIDVPQGVVVKNNTVSGYVQSSNSDGFGIVVEGINHSVTTNTVSGNDVGIQRQAGHLPYPGDGDQTNVADTYFGRGNSPVSCGITLTGNTLSSNGINTRDVGNSDGTGIVTNTNTSEIFCTIQAAIAATNTVNGHTLEVASGTYNEQVLVNKELIIKGVGLTKPIINFTGTGSGKLALFDVSKPNVTIENFEMSVDLSKIGSAIIASDATLSALTVKDNTINPYRSVVTNATAYGLRNAISINYGAYRINGNNPIGLSIQGNTVSYNVGADLVVGGTDDAGFRAGVSCDVGVGTFTSNTFQTVNQDIELRFSNPGNLMVSNNNFNGGGLEISEHNSASGTVTVSGNTFNGTSGNTYTNILRLKNNQVQKPTTVSSNTFTNTVWAASLENYRDVTFNNNTFTPLANSTTFQHITVNTKIFSSGSASNVQTAVDGTFTNNTFNGSGTIGGKAMVFNNHHSTATSYGTFTIGTSGNENNFNTGIQDFIFFDGSTGNSPGPTPATTMAPWAGNTDATFNKFDVSGSLKLPSVMTQAERTSLEGKLTHKFDTPALGKICLPTLGVLSSSLTAVCVNGNANLSVAITSATGPFTVVYTDGTTPVTVNSYVSGANIPVTVSATTTYSIVSITDAIGCVSTSGFTGTPTITVNPLPTATIGGTTAVCKNATAPNVTFTGADGTAPYTFTYKINGGADLTVTTTSGNSVTVAAPTATAGSFVYTLVSVLDASTTLCSQAQTGSATITVNELPTVGAGADVAICTGSSTTLTASGASTYTWSPATGLSATTGASITANPTATTTYTVTGTDANGCVNTDQVVVTVNALPIVSGGSDVAICIGGSTTLTASGASTYTWSPAAGLSATTGTAVTTNPTATTTYTVTGTDANGCVNTAQVVVTVNALPTVSTGSDVTICTGSSTTLTASGASTYTWSPATGLSATTGTAVTANPTATTTYTVIGTDANGCVNTDQVDVTVNPLPTVSVGSNVAICIGGSTTLNATGATSYTWSPATGLSATSGNPVTANPMVTTTYTVTGTDGNSCTNTAQVTITVNPLPTFTTAFTNPSCNGSTNGTITVTTSATSPMFSINGGSYVAGTSPYTFSALADGSYSITVKDANTCESVAQSVTLTQPAAIVVTATPIAALCFGGNGSIAMSATGGNNSYTFTSSPIAGTILGGTLTAPAGTYVITATDGNSCTGISGSITIGQPAAALSATTSKVDVLCFGGATGSASVLVSGGTSPYTYAWSPSGGTAATATGLIAGTYSVLITDANGCTLSKTIIVGQPTTATTITASSNTPVCEASALNLTSTPTSSTGGLTYAWSGPNTFTASTQNASIATTTLAAAGTYMVTVTDGNNCVATATTAVVINPLPTIYNVSGTGVICSGISTPITLSGSTIGINYKLTATGFGGSVLAGTGGALVFTPPSNILAVYTIEATNPATGCKVLMTGSVTTTNATNPTVTITAQTNVSCFGGSDGSVTAVASAGSGSYTYTFNGGASQSTGVFTGKTAGTYPIVATDVNTGCVGTVNAIITQPVSLPTATVASTGIACVGNTVTLTATATGGTAPYTYSWNGATATTSNTLTVTTTSTNTLVVTDSKGCIVPTVSTTVTFNALPIPTIAGATTICSGATLSLTANDGVTYLWAGPNSFTSTSAAISIPNAQAANAGVYSVMVTNANSCMASATTNVVINLTPTASITPTSAVLTCANPSATVTASGGDTYSWTATNGFTANTAIANVSSAGTYTVTASSSAGCTSTASVTITENKTAPTVGITSTATVLTCASLSTTITATGADTYSWSGPSSFSATTANATITTAGIYTVVGTSTANGCTALATIEITENKVAPTVTVTPTTAILTCANPSTALTASGATTYSWTGPGVFTASTAIANVSATGTYTVIGTGANGCTASASVVITEDKTPPTITVTPTSAILTCTNPTATITANGGVSYAWTGAATFTTSTITASLAGTYNVTVTGANGCIATASVVITEDKVAPTVGISTGNLNLTCTNPMTSLMATGSATSFSWTGPNGFTSSNGVLTTVSVAGVYVVTGMGANGCTAVASVTVTEDKNPPIVTVTPTSAILTCANPTTVITATGGVSYAWSGAATFTTSTINASLTGTYNVTVTGANGCTATASVTITEDKVAPTVGITNTGLALTCTTPSTTLTATGTGTSYSWTGAGTFTTSTITATIGGTYNLTVTGTNGCTASASVVISEDKATPTIVVTPTTAVLTCLTPSTTITASGATSYAWSGTGGFTATTATADILGAGTYTVIGTNANGCTASASVVITEDKATPTIVVTPTTAILTCLTPSTTITASGATSYAWSGTGGFTATTATADILGAGTYTVIGTNANGCTASASVVITEDKATPTVTVLPTTAVLTCLIPSTTITASGATSYAWSGTGGFTASTATADILGAGTYTVIGTNANGCSASTSVVITEDKATPTIVVTPTTAILTCLTPSTTITASSATSYGWSGTGGFTATTATADILGAGTYTVVGTNANGCTASTSVVITEDKATPTVTVLPTTAVLTCLTPSTTITASGATSYAWTGTGGFTATTATADILGAGTYTFIGTNANGCTASASVVITEDKATPTITITPTTAVLTCANPTTALTASGANTYSWSGPSGFTASTAIATISVGGTYTVIGTSAGGCTASASVVITENKVLPTVTVTGSATVCTGETLNLTATGGGTYAWAGPNAFNATTAAISLPFAVVAYSGTYTVTVTNANGCTANATTLVTVNAVPITPTVQANVNIPASTSITLTATGCAGTLLWFNAADNSSVTMPISPTATTTYYAKCSVTANSVTCIGQASGTVTVTVGPLVVISIKTGNWEDPTTWNVGRLPLVTEDVTIDSSHIITITTPTQATAKKLIYNTGATLNFGNTTAKLTLGSL